MTQPDDFSGARLDLSDAQQPAPDLPALVLACIAAAAPDVAGLLRPTAIPPIAAALHTLRVRPHGLDLPLVALADALALDDAELLAVVLTAAVETDAALCRTVAAIQNAAGGPQPLLGLPAAALASPQPPVETFFALPQGRAVRSCLLRLDNVDSALPERSLAIHLPTLAALTGHAADWRGGA